MVKAKKMMKGDTFHCGKHGWGVIILGILLILNTVYPTVTWPVFWGAILILVGLKMVILMKGKCC